MISADDSRHIRHETSILTTSFTSLPSHLKPVLRSYSEIRKQMHKSLQARLKGDYSSVFKSGTALSQKRPLRLKVVSKSTVTALENIRIEAKLKTLAARHKTEESIKPKTALPMVRNSSVDGSKSRHKSLPSYPMVSVKEAMKDRDWLGRARESILRNFGRLVNESNGVQVQGTVEVYKYFVKKGNNSKLIAQVMQTRPWWVRVKVKSEAHFLWSPKRELDWLRSLPCTSQSSSLYDPTKIPVSCAVKFTPQDSKVPRAVNIRPLGFCSITSSPSFCRLTTLTVLHSSDLRLHNRLEHNYNLTHKKALYHNLKQYYSSLGVDYTRYVPLTYHIKTGENDPEFHSFMSKFEELSRQIEQTDSDSEGFRNLWIVKPGENSNQGRDIVVCSSIDQIRSEIRLAIDRKTGLKRTFIIQKYIEKPYLYGKRKFDIRCYVLITAVNGVIQGYFYPEGYLRTSAREFSVKTTSDRYIHLTNDAVQKTAEDYGKFEHGNKVSFAEFQKYVEGREKGVKFNEQVLEGIRRLVQDSLKATYRLLDPGHRQATFEILGYDVMLDAKLRPLLIEVNTNPCLALVAPLLFRIIPQMLDGAFRLVLDTLFPEPPFPHKAADSLPENRWELIFHELVDATSTLSLLQPCNSYEDLYQDLH